VPPDVTWPPPDWTGACVGAWRLPELLEEFDEFDEAEPDPEELESAELFEEVTVLCAEPGSATATAPAATTLTKPTVAVVAFSLRRPHSRSATARERLRAP
jgi:hypothetical protein